MGSTCLSIVHSPNAAHFHVGLHMETSNLSQIIMKLLTSMEDLSVFLLLDTLSDTYNLKRGFSPWLAHSKVEEHGGKSLLLS